MLLRIHGIGSGVVCTPIQLRDYANFMNAVLEKIYVVHGNLYLSKLH